MKRTPLKRTSTLKRTGRLKPMSAKRSSRIGERKAVREIVMLRSAGKCVARLAGCNVEATDIHEIKTRARGGSIYDANNCLALCRHCHSIITTEPAWSAANGFVVSQWANDTDLEIASQLRKAVKRGTEARTTTAVKQ